MSFVCDRVGLESIMDGFDLYQCPCFSIWQVKDLKFTFVSDEIEQAKDVLEQNLQGLHSNSTALYKIKFYKKPNEKSGEIDRSTPECGSFTFRMATSDSFKQNSNLIANNDSQLIELMKLQHTQFLETIKAMNEKIDAIGSVEIPEEEETIYGKIGQALDRYPALNELAIKGMSFLERITEKIIPDLSAKESQQTPARQIAGINPIDKNMRGDQKITFVINEMVKAPEQEQAAQNLEQLSEALRVLLERDPDFRNTLIKLSQLPAMKYNMAKSML